MTDEKKATHTVDTAVIRHSDVHATCARCHCRIVLLQVPLRLSRDANELPDTTAIVIQLTRLGWQLPGPVCPTCKTTPAE